MSFLKNIKDSVTKSVVDKVDNAKDYIKNTETKEIAKDTAVLTGKAGLAVGKAGYYIGKAIVNDLVRKGQEVQRQEEKAKQDALEKAARDKEWEERRANRKPSAFELGLKKTLEGSRKK